MLWLKFPEPCNDPDPEDFTVELVSLQRGSEPAALRWRHSATEVVFRGRKPGKSGIAVGMCRYVNSRVYGTVLSRQ